MLRNVAYAIRKLFNRPVATAINISGERIETLRFSVPALRVGVLEYAPGQLQIKGGALKDETVFLFYPPEAVSDAEFLKSLENSPIVLDGHAQSTNETDKKIDGWPRVVTYDASEKAAIIDGSVKGAREAAYVRAHYKDAGFGASALVDIFDVEVKSGEYEGKKYNAVAHKLRAGHVTLAPYVRDPENKIEILNTVAVNSLGKIIEAKNTTQEGKTMDEAKLIALLESVLDKRATARNSEDKFEALEKTVNTLNDAFNMLKNSFDEMQKKAANTDKPDPAETPEGEEAANTDDEAATLENTKPSQKIIAAFASAYNTDFGKTKAGKPVTPGFSVLAALAGITETDAAKRIAAVNAKYAEISAAATAENAASKVFAAQKQGGVF